MRYLLIAIMIVLLPVRSWVGNAMALDGASQKVSMAPAAGEAGAEVMPEDCPMHAQTATVAADGTAGESPAGAGAHCSDCDSCELCLAVISFARILALDSSAMPQAPPALAASNFTDADVFSRLKPPIS